MPTGKLTLPVKEVDREFVHTLATGTVAKSKPWLITPDFDSFATSHPWIGQKTGNVVLLPNIGFEQQFQAATVFGPFGGQPQEVHGAIRDKYLRVGGPAGALGLPTTNETGTPDGKGRFNHFENGSIYWHPATGAFEVHGAIHAKWASLGWEGYGYPVTDESSTLDGGGRFNHFRAFLSNGSEFNGSIYWNPALGTYAVNAAIRSSWASLGWETSFLGYPVSDEYSIGDNRRSDFVNGDITWSPTLGTLVQPQSFVVSKPDITFGDGIPVGGYGNLAVFSDGTIHQWGHLHVSGLPSFDCLTVFSVKTFQGYAYAATQTGRIHGTDETGSRNMDWDEWGSSDDIRRNWPKIWSGGTGGGQVSVTSDWSPQKIAEDVLAVVGIILAIVPLVFFGGSSKSADPNYNPPEDFPIGGEPPPETGIRTFSS